ncbi:MULTISPECIES: NAD(P)/FAD-dependent oxidoreductase [Halorubrum]|uniref:NAD(P)/FAD-dependent oxidoreductase n=1 Tax=Halorubrum TaxID=56688 RepID=UPI000AD4BB06|nr:MULTISPECIES: FAD-dependent oxidoreductase [Halorubrum]TKX78178.1 NAD(P)/FAD-dependent oxidoreductase [Halorubrum sp. SD626R]
MTTQIVVVGSGYAGAGAVKAFEDEVGEGEAELTWISEHDYHLVLHEVHRAIRNPAVEDKITIPVDEIKSPESAFVQGRVVDVDVDDRVVETDDGTTVDYDYLLLAVGSTTAFFGIEGLEENAHQLKGLDDAKAIHEDVRSAAAEATRSEPVEVIVGGAGLSGIQTAGEIAEYRDKHRAPIEITLVEGLDEIFPNNDPQIQGALRQRVQDADIDIRTGDFISKADEDTVYLGGGEDEAPEELDYDVLIWTGGITGQPEIEDVDVEKDERSHRVHAGSDFTTSDDRVFAIGDTALVEQGDDDVAPPTAQAAWQAAEVAGENLARAARGAPLKSWTHEDKGTVISVGEEAVAHDVMGMPIQTFGGTPAKLLKKAIATRWIAKVSSTGRGVSAFGDM